MPLNIKAVIERFYQRALFKGRPPSVAPPAPPIRVHSSRIKAAQELVNIEAMGTPKVRFRMSGYDQTKTHPLILDLVEAVLKECGRRNIPLHPFELFRDVERQNKLKAQGVSKSSGGNSPHNYGCAVDLVHLTRWWKHMRQEHWEAMRDIVFEVARRRGISVVWGGDWDNDGVSVLDDPDERFWDAAHFQLANWKEWRAFYLRVGSVRYWAYIDQLPTSGPDWRKLCISPPSE